MRSTSFSDLPLEIKFMIFDELFTRDLATMEEVMPVEMAYHSEHCQRKVDVMLQRIAMNPPINIEPEDLPPSLVDDYEDVDPDEVFKLDSKAKRRAKSLGMLFWLLPNCFNQIEINHDFLFYQPNHQLNQHRNDWAKSVTRQLNARTCSANDQTAMHTFGLPSAYLLQTFYIPSAYLLQTFFYLHA